MQVSVVLNTTSPKGTFVYVRQILSEKRGLLFILGGITYLLCHSLNYPWEVMILVLPMLLPWRKISQLSIISIIGEPHLGSDEQNLLIVDDHTAVIDNIFVDDRPVRSEDGSVVR